MCVYWSVDSWRPITPSLPLPLTIREEYKAEDHDRNESHAQQVQPQAKSDSCGYRQKPSRRVRVLVQIKLPHQNLFSF